MNGHDFLDSIISNSVLIDFRALEDLTHKNFSGSIILKIGNLDLCKSVKEMYKIFDWKLFRALINSNYFESSIEYAIERKLSFICTSFVVVKQIYVESYLTSKNS